MQHGDEGYWAFLPTDEYPTKAIHPAASTFCHPAPSLEAGLLPDGDGFFAPGADVGLGVTRPDDVSDFVNVVALVETQPGLLRLGTGRSP